jgi:glycosyltransferase involved in cell wall biosynthesis
MAEILDADTGVLADPGSVEALADAVCSAARLDRAACRKRAVDEFSLDRMVSRYEETYERVAS